MKTPRITATVDPPGPNTRAVLESRSPCSFPGCTVYAHCAACCAEHDAICAQAERTDRLLADVKATIARRRQECYRIASDGKGFLTQDERDDELARAIVTLVTLREKP
jgi:hypothetical protein